MSRLLIGRENLDPLGQRSDAELNDLLQLIRINSAKGVQDKFRLDAEVLHEAANYSAGERQLCEWSRDNKVVKIRLRSSGATPSCRSPVQSAGHGRGYIFGRPRDRCGDPASHPDAIGGRDCKRAMFSHLMIATIDSTPASDCCVL